MEGRQVQENLSIVFGAACTAAVAVQKLQPMQYGSFLIRESSIEGLITISYKRKNGEGKDEFINVRVGLSSDLRWVHVPPDTIKAKEFAATAANAFKHIKDNPETIISLVALINGMGLNFNQLVRPAIKQESSAGYSGYNYHACDSEFKLPPGCSKK